MDISASQFAGAMQFVEGVRENSQKPKAAGWPKCFGYHLDDDLTARIVWRMHGTDEGARNSKQDSWHRLDCWSIAFIIGIAEHLGRLPPRLHLETETTHDQLSSLDRLKLEAFRRRVSYLQSGHSELSFEIRVNGNLVPLYRSAEITTRPEDERVPETLSDRGDDDKGEKLEKDFQAFLFNKGLKKSEEEGRCDRLAVLGSDFLKVKGKGWGVEREWPTSAYKGSCSEESRLLPRRYIDLVTLNRWRHLAIIELKVDDNCLEVIGQLLDYALYFSAYRDKLEPLVRKQLKWQGEIKYPMHCYVANNHYHPKFDKVSKFYGQGASGFGVKLIKLTLGETQEL